jgi:hypothetical protein
VYRVSVRVVDGEGVDEEVVDGEENTGDEAGGTTLSVHAAARNSTMNVIKKRLTMPAA